MLQFITWYKNEGYEDFGLYLDEIKANETEYNGRMCFPHNEFYDIVFDGQQMIIDISDEEKAEKDAVWN
jgi:hypothetical protein